MSVSVKVNRESIALQVEGIEQRLKDAIRPAAYAGAMVYYNEVRMRAPYRTGRLRDSIYIAHSDDNSQPGVRETYHVSWNKKQAPHGHLLEYGTRRMAARPFLRPAHDAAKARAEAAVMQTLQEHINGSGDHRGD